MNNRVLIRLFTSFVLISTPSLLFAGGGGGLGYYVGKAQSTGVESNATLDFTSVYLLDVYGFYASEGDLIGGFFQNISLGDSRDFNGLYFGAMVGKDFAIGDFSLGINGKIGIGALFDFTWINDYTYYYSATELAKRDTLSSFVKARTEGISAYGAAELKADYKLFRWMKIGIKGGVSIISKLWNNGLFNSDKLWFTYIGFDLNFGSFD